MGRTLTEFWEQREPNYCTRNATEWHRCNRGYFWGGKCIIFWGNRSRYSRTYIKWWDNNSTLERTFEIFSKAIECRLRNIDERIIGAKDSHIEKIGDDNSDNALFQFIEKSPFWAGKSNNGKGYYYLFFYLIDSLIKTSMVILVLIKPLMTIITVFKRELIILLIITSLWSNIMIIIKNKKVTSS